MNPRFTLIWTSLLLTATWTAMPPVVSPSYGQTGTNSTVLAPPKTPLTGAPTISTLQQWYSKQWFDEVIEGATLAIGSTAKPDPRYFYYRGRAFYDIGFFRRAEEDLKPLGGFKPFSNRNAASSYVEKVAASRAFVPPNFQEIKDAAGRTRFLIYYGEDDEWTRTAIAALQEARAVNLQMVGLERFDTPVLLFDDRDKFNAFTSARSGKPEPTWPVGKGGSFGFYLRRLPPRTRRMSRNEISGLRSTVAHEYHHSIVNRFVGNGVLPKWLTEGLARCASDLVMPAVKARDEAAFRRAWQKGGVMGFNEITLRQGFMDAMDEKTAPAEEIEGEKRGVDPYAQAHHMAAYFLSRLEPGGLQKFLVALRAERKFADVFQKQFQWAPREFYDAWFEHCRTLYGDPPAPQAPIAPAPAVP